MAIKDCKARPSRCPLCAAAIEAEEIAGNFVYGGREDQKFYLCRACDIAFLYPPMSNEEEKRFYSKEFEKFMEKRSPAGFDWSGPEQHIKANVNQYKRRLAFFKDFLKPGKRVLEIGCSSGFMLLPLKEAGLYVAGVEPSANFKNFLVSKGVPVYDSLHDLEKSDDGKNGFDIVLHFFVLEHVRDPIGFIKEGLACLKPGGVMVFEVPSRSDPLVSVYNIPAFHKFYWSVAHNSYFNRRSLEFVLGKVADKFEIIPEQRYDLSNHITWALEGRPGGQGRYSAFFTPELERTYLESMMKMGHCDTLIGRVYK